MTDPDIARLQFHNDRLRKLVDSLEHEKKAMQKQHNDLLKTTLKLATFFETGIGESWDGLDWNGGDLQDKALELGLIVSDGIGYCEQADCEGPMYTYAPEIKNLMDERE